MALEWAKRGGSRIFFFKKKNFLKRMGLLLQGGRGADCVTQRFLSLSPISWDSVAEMTGPFAIIKAPLGRVGESVVSEQTGLVSGGGFVVLHSSWRTMLEGPVGLSCLGRYIV